MQTPRGITALFLLLILGVSSALQYSKFTAGSARTENLAAVFESATTTLDARVKTTDCAVNGSLPDHACTPGAVFPDSSEMKFCTPGYTKEVRNVPQKERLAVFAEYGISNKQPFGSYEVDHLIPLAIGGSNDIANLFPEAATPTPGFRQKDIVEVYLQEQTCAGKISLAAAQAQIANDWLSIYNNLSPSDITRIKAKYKNWSN